MFNRLKPEDYPALKPYFEKHRYPLCEYSLASIIIWNRCLYEVSWKLDGPCCCWPNRHRAPAAGACCCRCRPFRNVARRTAEIAGRNRHTRYYYVPQDYFEKNRAGLEEFFPAEQPAAWTTCTIPGTGRLEGRKYAKKGTFSPIQQADRGV